MDHTAAGQVTPSGTRTRGRLRTEVLIVLGLSLGQAGVYALVRLVAITTDEGGVAAATATLNASRSERAWLDLTYQLLGIGFDLLPVALALFLLAGSGTVRRVVARIGLDAARPARDVAAGVALAAVIGIPGLGLYLVGRRLGITADVVASGLDTQWWTVPVLVLAAVQAGLLEEVVVVAYLLDRLPRLGWALPVAIAASAVLRGSYHAYQGFGPFAGNVAMGVLFAVYYQRTGRVMPLVIAHTLLDVVAFVGYQYAGAALGLR